MPEWPRAINEEMRQHLDDEYEALRGRGFSHDAAMRALAGDVEEAASLRMRPIDALRTDVRYALRTVGAHPGFSAVVLLTLALGIGATTAVFTVVDAVMLRPYPYPDMPRIMMVSETVRTGQPISIAWPNFQDWRAQNQVFDALGLYRGTVMNLTGGAEPERLIGSLASADVFRAVGMQAIVGRTFTEDEDKPGAPRVVILSDRLWRSHFNADPSVVGRSIVLNGETHAIVGVMPAAMRFPSRVTDVWLPLGLFVPTFPTDRGAHPGLFAVAKLKPGVSVERAVADMDTIARRLERQNPLSNTDHTVSVVPYYEQIVQNIRPALLTLMGAVAFVLLIGCANLANLMLAKAEARQRELAIREALGATRWRVFQQLLTESVLMAVGGGALGALLAWWGVKGFVASRPATVPRVDLIAVDLRVLGFALAVSIATGIVFGLAPALRASSLDLLTSLKDATRASRGAGRRLRSALVVAEVALALVLLTGAGLTMRSFAALTAIDLGFDPSHVVTMRMALPSPRYPDLTKWLAFHRELVQRAAAIPGVEAAGLNSAVPLEGGGSESEVRYEGQPLPQSVSEEATMCLFQAATPDYFRALGIAIVRGRSFDDRDTADRARVAVVEEALVHKFFGDADPIGKRIAFEFTGHGPSAQPLWREIVGIARHVRHYGIAREPANMEVYAPLEQLPIWFRERRPGLTLFVRTPLDPEHMVASVRQTVASLDREIPLYAVQTMDEYVGQATEQPRLNMTLLGLFAALALMLAGLGIYGVLSYIVGRRTLEIGIRLALGATPGDVLRLVVGHGMTLAFAGIAIGLAAAWAITRTMQSLLFGVSPHDPATFAAIAALLGAIAFVASYLPGRRATRVDPVETLRAE
ncbi:MAG TPA: ABC transporter permease [Vicinamibacterales bacterium]|nr:ABC transporter permease [Vicinamibacterales bacterium]